MGAKVFGIIVLLAVLTLVIALAPLADSNLAVTASSVDTYEVIHIPGRTQITPLHGNITDMAIGSDGNTIYVIDSTLNNVVYVSTDGGYNFKRRTVPTGLDNPLRAVDVAPDDPNVVAVVDSKPAKTGATEGGIVWISNNSGWTWTALPSVPSDSAVASTFITDIAIGPALSGTVLGRNYLVCSRDLTTGVTGRVHITGTTAEWEDLASGFPLYPLDFTSCRFSPSYPSDRSIVTVGSLKGGTFQNIVLVLGMPQSVTHVSLGASPTDTQIITSDIALPLDFYAAEDILRISFVTWDSSTNKGEDVYRVDDIFVTGLNVPEADKGIRSIAYADNKLLVGMQATNQVYRTEDPFALSPTWYASIIPPAGDTDVVVGMNPRYKETHTCYAGTSGPKGGFFSISIDNGITFPAPLEPPGTEVTTPAYEFPKPVIRPVKIPTGVDQIFETFDQVSVMGLYNYGEPGEPVLPYKTCRILIPPGHELVSVEVTGEKIELPGEYLVEPGQIPIPAGNDNFTYTPPNPDIYGADQPFPYLPYRVMSVQTFRGYRILLVNLMSIEYIGAEKKISYFRNIDVGVKTAPTEEVSPLYRSASADEEQVEDMVDNPGSLEEYPPTGEPVPASLLPGEYDMVIITDSTLTPTFQDYADWRTDNRGIRTAVYDIATILATYSGYDNAERLRNFIIDAYTNWGIEYVLLGGDVEIIPYRLLRSEAHGGEDIPADIYYAGLDGNWDNDGDHIYGEMSPAEEADLFAEVYVGRAPVNNITEAQNVCNKIRSYEESNLSSYRCDWLFFTTILDSYTNGGDYKEQVEANELNPPHGFNITRVYEHTGGTRAQVIAALNAGQRIGNACGHGNYDYFGLIYRTDVDNLTNTEYCLIYTWACLTNKFEVENTDAISEHFLFTAHGAFAYIGNSRYGWYYSGSGGGLSHEFELEFYDALIDEEVPRVGWALQDSKEEFSGSTSLHSRWIYYGLNLMGDPATLLRIKNDLLVRDHPLDDGTLPSDDALGTSPDIAVDQPLNGWQTPSPFIVHENPEYGSTNRVYVRVSNLGCEDAGNVTVRLYWADPAGGMSWPVDWNYIGESVISTIPAGGEATSPYIDWTPPGTAVGQQSLLATVETNGDPISTYNAPWDSNVARLNVTGPEPPDVLLIRDHPLDDGSLPSNDAFWTSPDIAVDQPLNGWQTPSPFIVHENPEYDSINRVYIRVHNQENEDASDVTVRLYWADPAGGISWPGDWNYIGGNIISTIPAGGEVITPYIEWTPSGTAIGNRCLLATVETTGDPISTYDVQQDNNVAQLNVSIADSGKSHATSFVLNPLTQSGKRDLKVTLLGAPQGTTVKLKIPREVDIENVEGASVVKKPASRWSLSCSCFPSCEDGNWWRITVTSTSIYTETTATISEFNCEDKEAVNLEIEVPDDAGTGNEFIIRITEELDGETIGGIDYIVRF